MAEVCLVVGSDSKTCAGMAAVPFIRVCFWLQCVRIWAGHFYMPATRGMCKVYTAAQHCQVKCDWCDYKTIAKWRCGHKYICFSGRCLLRRQCVVLTLASRTRRLRSNSQLTLYFWRAKMGLTMVSIGYQNQTVYKWHLATANYSQLQFRCSRNGGCQVFDFAPNI